MRALNILSGLAVLVTAAAFAQILRRNVVQHLAFLQQLDAIHASHQAARNPAFLVGFSSGVVILVFSLIGSALLLRRKA